MSFDSPHLLLLFIPILVIAFKFKQFVLYNPIRMLMLASLALVLAQPSLIWTYDSIELFLLVDKSLSVEHAEGRINEIEYTIEATRPSSSTLHTIYFAQDIVDNNSQGASATLEHRESSRLGQALLYTLQQAQHIKNSRIAVVTDGYSTDSLENLSNFIDSSRIPVDFRLIPDPPGTDYSVTEIRLPPHANEQEKFLLEARIEGTKDRPIEAEILQDGKSIGIVSVQIVGGSGMLRVGLHAGLAGAHNYKVRLLGIEDSISGNNSYEAWLRVNGPERLLLLSNHGSQDPLIPLLEQAGFEVQVPIVPSSVDAAQLINTRAVLLHNISAFTFDRNFLKSLRFYVEHQGGGLLLIGGNNSFAAGGYSHSPIDRLFPVSFESPEEYRAYDVAIGIVMDISGSMSAIAPGSQVPKIHLANEGASRAVHYLKDRDLITVIAVDSQAQEIVPLIQVGPSKQTLVDTIQRIRTGGGGIYVYSGLEAVWEQLKGINDRNKHVILFSDAADSEEPGDYQQLVHTMRQNNTTVSVIGLGNKSDPDAALLEDIATIGGGKMLYCEDASTLPDIFAQDIAAFTQKSYVDEPAPTLPTASWHSLTTTELSWPLHVDSYNISFLRKNARSALNLADQQSVPLVAFWEIGLGRSATISFPLTSPTIAAWPQKQLFIATLLQWLARNEYPAGISIKASQNGEQAKIELVYSDEWYTKIAENSVDTLLSSSLRGPFKPEWNKIEPGKMSLTKILDPGEIIQGVVKIGRTALPIPMLGNGSQSEWQFSSKALNQLRQISRRSGGKELTNLAEAWDTTFSSRHLDLRFPLLWLLLGGVLLDAWLTQIGKTPCWSFLAKRLAKGS